MNDDFENQFEEIDDLDLSDQAIEPDENIVNNNTAPIKSNAYNKFSQTNLGRNLISQGQNKLNQSNNPLAKIASNKINRMMTPPIGTTNNNQAPDMNSTTSSSGLPNKDELQKKDETENKDTKKNEQNNKSEEKKESSNNFLDALKGKKTGKKSLLGNKKLLLLKLKILGIAIAAFAILYAFIFIWFVIDGDEQNFLELTNWNISSNPTQNQTVSSDTNFNSNTNNETLTTSLGEKIGEEGITELTNKINNAGNNRCDGTNVAQKLVTLIDEVSKKGYKIPYSNNSTEYKGVDPDWGKTIDNNVVGLNEYSLINWGIQSANINNPITNIKDYNDRSNKIDLAYGNPGDLVINNDKAYIIIQNTGENVTLAYIDSNGLDYKKNTYKELSSYNVIDMSSYYSTNCKN